MPSAYTSIRGCLHKKDRFELSGPHSAAPASILYRSAKNILANFRPLRFRRRTGVPDYQIDKSMARISRGAA